VSSYLGLNQIYKIISGEPENLNELIFKQPSATEIMQIIFRAMVFFLVNVQLQIFNSKGFERLQDYKDIGRLRGQAVTFLYNNEKIKKYVKYQEMNYNKEQMIEEVKKKCMYWKLIFKEQ